MHSEHRTLPWDASDPVEVTPAKKPRKLRMTVAEIRKLDTQYKQRHGIKRKRKKAQDSVSRDCPLSDDLFAQLTRDMTRARNPGWRALAEDRRCVHYVFFGWVGGSSIEMCEAGSPTSRVTAGDQGSYQHMLACITEYLLSLPEGDGAMIFTNSQAVAMCFCGSYRINAFPDEWAKLFAAAATRQTKITHLSNSKIFRRQVVGGEVAQDYLRSLHKGY